MKQKFLSVLKASVKSPWGGLSSTRVSSFILLSIIYLSAFVFIGIEIVCAIIALKTSGVYHISNESIIIFGSLLTHHLTLLGLNKSHETKQLNNESKGVATDKKIDQSVNNTELDNNQKG